MSGSLLGLDLGLSRLALRRVADQQMPAAPTLTLNDLATLTRTAVALVAADLTDAERDEIAGAISRGGPACATPSPRGRPPLDALALELRMSDGDATTVALDDRPASPRRVAGVFSLRDLMWLGRPPLTPGATGSLGRRRRRPRRPPDHGDAAAGAVGRLRWPIRGGTDDDASAGLDAAAGRGDSAARAAGRRWCRHCWRLRWRTIWHEVRVRFADDWPQLTRQAARLASARIEDYVAALTGNGPLRAQ